MAFKPMNANITSLLPGGKTYHTVYPASVDQDSSSGTADIINHIQTTLAGNPDECFILQGYSQGAAATVNAMPSITGSAMDAVKGVVLVGDSEHKAGYVCNVDNYNGTSTRNANGLSFFDAGIPSDWIGRTLDVCIYGDGVCDPGNAVTPGINLEHLEYGNDDHTQSLGSSFALYHLGSSTF